MSRFFPFVSTVCFLAVSVGIAGVVRAQDDAATQYGDTEQPCIVDERVSLWLSLEAADRTIAALETERRQLALELAQVLEDLDLIDRQESGLLDEGSLAETVAALKASAEGESGLDAAYVQIDSRLVDIDRTLKRRRAQQAALEDQIDRLLETTE